jgi:hypothetical protein
MPRERIAINPSARASRMTVKTNESLSADRTITPAEIEQYQAFRFTPTISGRNVVMPNVAVCAGVYCYIYNAAATALSLTVQTDAPATIVVVPQSKCAILFCDGVIWSFELGA